MTRAVAVVALVTSGVLNGVGSAYAIIDNCPQYLAIVHGESGAYLTRCFQFCWNLVTILICWDGVDL